MVLATSKKEINMEKYRIWKQKPLFIKAKNFEKDFSQQRANLGQTGSDDLPVAADFKLKLKITRIKPKNIKLDLALTIKIQPDPLRKVSCGCSK